MKNGLKFSNFGLDLESPNRVSETGNLDIMKFQPFKWNGSAQIGLSSGKYLLWVVEMGRSSQF